MAGETPRAHNLGKKKKKLNWQDDRSTDKYYGSGNPSAIQHTHGDTVGRPGDPPKPVPVNPARVDERNADKKYYANPPAAPTVQQRAKSGQLPMPGGAPLPVNVPRQRLPSPSPINKIVIGSVDEVNAKMEQLCDILSGDNQVVVEVPNSDLLRRVRAKLDTMVTRELLTEDLARDVRFSKVEAAAATPAIDLSKPPEPAASVSVDERDGDFLDPAAVLSGAVSVDEPVVDTTPTDVTEAEVTDEAETSADDDGDDFLAPQAAATQETTPVEDSSSAETPDDSTDEESSPAVATASPETSSSDDEAETDEPTRPKKPGRRSGRGTK